MTRRSWSTREQHDWLIARTAAFIQAREKGTLPVWHAELFQSWFDQFPEPPPTEEQIREAKGDTEAAKTTAIEKRKTVSYNFPS